MRLNFSQADVARQLGISRERLASYEDGRAPLRFELALRFCWQFVFNEEWLALGGQEIIARANNRDPQSRHVWDESWARRCMSLLTEPICHKIKPGTIYIDAFKHYLEPVFQEFSSRHFGPRVIFSGASNDDQLKNYFHALMELWLDTAKTPLKKFRFLSSMADAAERIEAAFLCNDLTNQEREKIISEGRKSGRLPDHIEEGSKEMEDYLEKAAPDFLAKLAAGFGMPIIEKNPVDNISFRAKYVDVKHSLPNLLERLNRATAVHGQKTELAKYLGVPLASVSQWLSGVKEPGGQTTLKLLNWVEQKERQK